MKPKISVVVTAYNESKRIEYSLDSILNQTFDNIEIIVVDDASEDNTCDIVDAFNDNRINLIRLNERHGVGAARNIGLRYATAPYIAICDADDVYDLRRFEKQVNLLEKKSDIYVVGSYAKVVSDEGQYIRIMKFPKSHNKIKKRCFIGMPFAHDSLMIRREAIEYVGGYYEKDKKFFYDYEFVSRLISKFKAQNIPEPLMTYVQHSSSVMNSTTYYYWLKRHVATQWRAIMYNTSKKTILIDIFISISGLIYLMFRKFFKGF